jgi:hypothetical protein
MNSSSLTRLAASVLVTGVAGVAFAAPASAVEAINPDTGNAVHEPAPAVDSGGDSNWTEIGLGALGGLVLAGAGVAAAAGVRRRSVVPTA